MIFMREGALEVITSEGPRIGFDISLPLNKIQDFVEEMRGQSSKCHRCLSGIFSVSIDIFRHFVLGWHPTFHYICLLL